LPTAQAQVFVVIGPARSGKTQELLRVYESAILDKGGAQGLDRAIWIAPNSRTAAAVREQLAARAACLRPGVLTFVDLARQILIAAGSRHKMLDNLLQRELLRRMIESAASSGRLSFYGEAARRSGFVDLIAEHVAELQRRDIRPDAYAKAVSRRSNSKQLGELASLYSDYESVLAAHNLADTESANLLARDALTKNTCPRFQNLELIVADGFTDFSPVQLELLELLSRRAKQLFVSLPGEHVLAATGRSRPATGSERAELFAKTADTLRDLQKRFPRMEVRRLEPRPLECPAIDHLTRNIFRHPAHIPAASAAAVESLSQIKIIAAAGAQDEIVQMARSIKARLLGKLSQDGSRPGDIVVVFRSLTEVAPRVREIFSQFGIPYYLELAPRVGSAPLVQTLLDLLDLEHDDWPFRRVVSVLANNTIRALDDEARRAAEWLVRDLQIAAGKISLTKRVEALAAELAIATSRGEHHKHRVQAAASALPAVQKLATALSELPEEISATQWSESLLQLISVLGLAPAEAGDTPEWDASCAIDVAAWQSVAGHIARLERFDDWLGQPRRTLGRREIVNALREVAAHVALPRVHDECGRVRILSAPAARNVSARHLYLAGMSELSFPSPERAGRLASDAEYRRIEHARQRSIGTNVNYATRARGEMLLFYEMLSRAEESLTISYPALDEKAQTLPASPYVDELERILPIVRSGPELSPVPIGETPYCIGEWRVQAVSRAIDADDRRLLAGIFAGGETKSLAAAIDAGLAIVHARARGELFGPTEGLLVSDIARSRLASRFGTRHTWSASQWESYAACPFKFFLEGVLGLAPLGDLTLEIDHRRRGSIVHDVLATFHRKLSEAPAESWNDVLEDESRFVDELRGTLQEAMRVSGSGRDGIDAALLELDRRQIEKWIDRYRAQYQKYHDAWTHLDSPMRPTHFELRFGQAGPGEGSAEDPHSVDDAFMIDIGSEQILVTGRIDRIDIGEADGKTVFNVVDYKSGRRPTLTSERVESGECLQPALYVMAAQALVLDENATPLWAGYWSMQNGITTEKRYSLVAESWPALKPKVVERIRTFVEAIRGGEFPVDSCDVNCTSRCEFNTICRVSQARSVGKVRSGVGG
jgi:ATP-dependent helicase/nuclease subunit B